MSTTKMSPTLKYRHIATVRWIGKFPIDMLRYDSCHPADSEAITAIIQGGAGATVAPVPLKAHLVAYSVDKRWPFTHDRWHSFGCNIEPMSIGELP